MTHPHNESPVNPLPPVVVATFLLMAAVEAAFSLGERGLVGGRAAVGWRTQAMETYGFSGVVFDWMMTTGQWPVEHLMRFVTYPFIHVTFTHALFALVILLALGKIVTEALGTIAFVIVFVVTGTIGAAVWGLVLDDPRLLVGGYPPVYGLIGSFTYLLWMRLGQTGGSQIRAFTLIGVLLLIQLIFGIFFGAGSDWVADLAGFAAGFVLTILLAPGGWAKIRAAMRRD